MAFDAFLKIDGIEGESSDKVHSKEIEVLSWSWGADNHSATGGGGAGQPAQGSLFEFTHRLDKASPQLMLACAAGTPANGAQLSVRRTVNDKVVEYLYIKMTNVIVSSFQQSGHGSSDTPTESVSLAFAKIEMDYYPVSRTGSRSTVPTVGAMSFTVVA